MSPEAIALLVESVLEQAARSDALGLEQDERTCDLCRTAVGVETLSNVEHFPLVKVCETCVTALDDESVSSRADDPGCDLCAGGCIRCLGLPLPGGV